MIVWLHESKWNPSYLFDYADEDKNGKLTIEEVKMQVPSSWYDGVEKAFKDAKNMPASTSPTGEITKVEMNARLLGESRP